MFHGKPIIGIAGGIGSGKSFIARLFGEEGCLVLSADDAVSEVYQREDVRQTLRNWWGDEVIAPYGINRRAIAARVFGNPPELQRLERLLHPLVAEARDRQMLARVDDPAVRAFVWDVPLLFETGQHQQCDAVVFVDAPLQTRLKRVQSTRGWDAAELARRENLQWPLDKKRDLSDHTIRNTADAGSAREQVRRVLSQILSRVDGNDQPGESS